MAQIEHVFGGRGPQALPLFDPPNAAELQAALADGPNALGADPLAADDFLLDVAPVRAGAGRLQSVLAAASGLPSAGSGAAVADVGVAQLPFAAGTPWAGLPGSIPGGQLSLLVHRPDVQVSPIGHSGTSGLMVDERIEVVPSDSETTGLAFHYDAPGSAPPQAMLLAVPPAPARRWSLDWLESILLETLELAQLRAVDPDTVKGAGALLPARPGWPSTAPTTPSRPTPSLPSIRDELGHQLESPRAALPRRLAGGRCGGPHLRPAVAAGPAVADR